MILHAGAMVLILSFMWPFGAKDWREAEKVWRAGMQAEGNPQKDAQHHDWMPYAFLTRTGTTNVYRIVHKGRLLPQGGGVGALAAYLRDIDAFKRDKLKESDLRELLDTFAALPPSQYKYTTVYDSLKPSLRRTADKIELVVNCVVPEGNRHGMPPEDESDVERWTLTIDHQHAAWAKQMIKVKTEAPTSL